MGSPEADLLHDRGHLPLPQPDVVRAIDLLDDSSGYWFYWPMLGTGLGVLVTGVVLGGVGGLFGKDWERRQVQRYLGEQGDQETGPDAKS